MNMNKPLVQQWKDNLIRSILPQAIAAGLLVLLTIFTLSVFAGFIAIAVVLCVFLIVDINKEYKVYKYSLRALESESDLGPSTRYTKPKQSNSALSPSLVS